MKKKLFNFLVIIITTYLLVLILLNKEVVFKTINFSFAIWKNNVFPSLFPFFIISNILINYDISYYLKKIFHVFFKYLFNLNENESVILILSMIGGFPSNARNIRLMYDDNLINKNEAERLLMFTHFSNPLFILGTVAVFFLNNERLGLIILLSHYLSNIIIAIIVKNICPYREILYKRKNKNNTFGIILTKSIKGSIDTMLIILGSLTCFLVISSVLLNNFHLPILGSVLVKGSLELTQGLESIKLLNYPSLYQVLIAVSFLSFGGASVHLQVISQISETNISYFPYLLGRIMQVVISLIITPLLYFCLL